MVTSHCTIAIGGRREVLSRKATTACAAMRFPPVTRIDPERRIDFLTQPLRKCNRSDSGDGEDGAFGRNGLVDLREKFPTLLGGNKDD